MPTAPMPIKGKYLGQIKINGHLFLMVGVGDTVIISYSLLQ